MRVHCQGMLRLAPVLAVLAFVAPARASELPGRAGMYAPAGAPLAMLDSEIDVTVHGPIIEATVTQTFRNDTDQATEATYIFPLPLDAAVTAMAMKIGSTTIHAAIEPRQHAAERYERALAQGAPAALLDQERPDVFTQSVAAVPARGTVEVTLRFDTTARYTNGQWELAIPLVVAPRYVPGSATGRPTTGAGHAPDTDRAPDASHVTPPGSPDAGGKTTIHLHIDGDVADLGSPTHQLDGTTLVDPHSDHDAVIRWRAKLPEAALVEPDGFAAVVVSAPPAKPTGTAHASLLVDRSATTRGDASLVEVPLVHALSAGIAREPGAGDAGASAVFDLSRELAKLPRKQPVVLVTDGLVADDAAVVAAAKSIGAPVHVLGVGPAPNRSLLTAIATATSGTVRFVLPGDPLDAIARDVLADVTSPPAPVAITWGTLAARDVVPATLPRLGAGQAALVLARVDRPGKGNARVDGAIIGFTAVTTSHAPEGSLTPLGALGRRWARGKLDDLVAAGNARAITEHALRYGLVSPETSMVAIGDEVILQGGIKHTVAVPVSVPAGMRWQLVEQATHVDTEQSLHWKKNKKGGDDEDDRPRKKTATKADEDDDGAEDKEEVRAPAAAAPTIDASAAMGESIELTSISSSRRLRFTAALAGGVHVVNGDATGLGGVALRAETGYRTMFGGEASLWLVDGLHGEGSLLATVARRGIAHRFELGAGAGLRITGASAGPALDFALRMPLSRLLRLTLRYDGALLLHGSTFDGENATTLGVEASW